MESDGTHNMSRIDEALKRMAQPGPADDREGGASTPSGAGASILERYSTEASPAASTPFQPERPNVRFVRPQAESPTSVRKIRTLSSKLVGSPDIAPVIVEQFRRLAAVMHDAQAQTGLKILMVSSAVPAEGKTFTAVNLALTLAESLHRRVLLVDGDLRRPTIHDLLGCENEVGLADVLRTGTVSLPLVEASDCLSVLTAGRPTSNPLAQLTSDRLRHVLDDAAQRFDWVVIDTPPVALLPDAQLVARMAEGVLFVIAAGSTPYALVNRSVGELGAERIVGTVLNRVDRRSVVAAEYYGGYYSAGASRA
jgi:capsular exopolysaccharide synthesis family protein